MDGFNRAMWALQALNTSIKLSREREEGIRTANSIYLCTRECSACAAVWWLVGRSCLWACWIWIWCFCTVCQRESERGCVDGWSALYLQRGAGPLSSRPPSCTAVFLHNPRTGKPNSGSRESLSCFNTKAGLGENIHPKYPHYAQPPLLPTQAQHIRNVAFSLIYPPQSHWMNNHMRHLDTSHELK